MTSTFPVPRMLHFENAASRSKTKVTMTSIIHNIMFNAVHVTCYDIIFSDGPGIICKTAKPCINSP